MLVAVRRGLGVAAALLVSVAASATAAPLGLSPGDTITSISFDALKSGGNPGDGGEFDVSTNLFTADGRFNSILTTPSGTINLIPLDVTYNFNLNFVTESLTGSGNILNGEAFLRSPGLMPDFIVQEGGVNILFGDFAGNLRISGAINIVDPGPQVLSGIGRVTFTGGNAALLDALDGIGGQANVLLSATIGDFDPSLGALALDGQVFNSNFTVSLSGSLIPLNPQPFVPEPSTAMLVGAGLLGLLGIARRRSR